MPPIRNEFQPCAQESTYGMVRREMREKREGDRWVQSTYRWVQSTNIATVYLDVVQCYFFDDTYGTVQYW